jgi:hypothetical protein
MIIGMITHTYRDAQSQKKEESVYSVDTHIAYVSMCE